MVSLKALSTREQRLTPGHRMCAGCATPIIVKQILMASETPVVLANSTGCLEVATTIYPYTAWNVPWIHSAFENVAPTIAGAETSYRALKRRGRLPVDTEINFIAFGGDGASYDIGFGAISGVLERGHRVLYVCYDNQAYMNTGIQRSAATPRGASTTTSPAGEEIPGKVQYRKDLTRIVAAHNIPYAAQASPAYFNDLIGKVQKALSVDGPSFLNVISSCNRGWRHDTAQAIALSRLAVETCFWPLYEVDHGEWKLTSRSRVIADGRVEKKPIVEWLKVQGRFRHLFKPKNEHITNEIQQQVDKEWARLLKDCGKLPKTQG